MINAGLAVTAGAAAMVSPKAQAAETSQLPVGAATLRELATRLAKAPRRRDFKTVPMILNDQSLWDHEALSEVLAYRAAGPRQAYDNAMIDAPWLNLMRNALNAQIWSYDHPNFLVVSATHGTAHLALFDQAMWDKYQFAKLIGGKFKANTLINETSVATKDAANYQDPEGIYSPRNNSIPALQRRGVVFLACHNSIWEVSEKLIAANVNPDKLSHDKMATELTNHLIKGAVLTPGIVATLPELQQAGFFYIRG
jgi:hypothetical protein